MAKHGKMAHHGTHKGSGHGQPKKKHKTVGGHNGMAAGVGKHLNNTADCSAGACGPNDYFQGTNEHMYGDGDGDE